MHGSGRGLREALRRRLFVFMQRTPMRPLLARVYGLALLVSLLLVGAGVGWLIYTFMTFSSAGQLAIHVEAAWYNALPSTRPPDEVRHTPHAHHFVLEAPLDLARQAPALVRDIASHPFFAARIIDIDGRVLGESSNASVLPPITAETIAGFTSVDHSDGFPHHGLTHLMWDRWQVLIMPLTRDGKVVALIQAGISFRMHMTVLRQIATTLLVGTLLALLLGYAISSYLAGTLVAPLERLAEMSRRMASGDFGARTGLSSGRNEVMQVAASFDDMAERLNASFDAQRRFVADASHELKTPLTAIGGMVDLMEAGVDADPSRRKTMLATMQVEVERMGALIGDLLTLSRAEQHAQVRVPVDVALLLSDLVDETMMRHDAHPVECTVKGPLWSLGESEALRRALDNLLSNAFKYSSAGSVVSLGALRSGEWIEIEVRDRGIGIPADDLPRVFDRFYRADRSRARATGGTGLGLSIVRAIVEAHEGTVELESTPGQGTLVRVRLPSRG